MSRQGRAPARVLCFSFFDHTTGNLATMRINLKWKIIDESHVALIFDRSTFAAFQIIADARGVEPTDMIAEALAKLLGPVVATRSGD